MKVIETIKEMQSKATSILTSGKSIGFVPTMGFLHEGHLALIKKAREENEIVVASIFVNPLQFGPNEDFETYPRDFERDRVLAEENGVDYLFYPSVKEMYPAKMTIKLTVAKRVDCLCGRTRIGHFDGVATVLLKLFSIVRPNRVYFGLKDAQQVAVVDGLIKDFNLPIQLCPVDTVREEDGLAKSSRNVYLTGSERKEAKELYQSLLIGKERIKKGEKDPKNVVEAIQNYLNSSVSGSVEYVEVLSYPELEELRELHGRIILALAVKFSKARLIDNIIIDVDRLK